MRAETQKKQLLHKSVHLLHKSVQSLTPLYLYLCTRTPATHHLPDTLPWPLLYRIMHNRLPIIFKGQGDRKGQGNTAKERQSRHDMKKNDINI